MENYIKNRPVLMGGIAFAIGSIVFNTLSIILFGRAHVNDIVHVWPIVLLIEPFIDQFISPWMLLPLAVLIDFIAGLFFGWLSMKFTKTPRAYIVSLVALFILYWVVITFQWILIV